MIFAEEAQVGLLQSVVALIDIQLSQINYALRLVYPVIKGLARSFTVKEQACEAYNASMQRKLSDSVYVHCKAWYQSKTSGKNVAIFPGPLALYWWKLRNPVWAHYDSVDSDQWRRWLIVTKFAKWIAVPALIICFKALWSSESILASIRAVFQRFIVSGLVQLLSHCL